MGLTALDAYNSTRAGMYATFRQFAPEFDVNGIGLTGWRGRSLEAGAGPELYSRGPFRYAQARGFLTLGREVGYPDKCRTGNSGSLRMPTSTNQMSACACSGQAALGTRPAGAGRIISV